MPLSQKQATAILILQKKWQEFKALVEEKDANLQVLLGAAQKEITQEGIVLLRRYQVSCY